VRLCMNGDMRAKFRPTQSPKYLQTQTHPPLPHHTGDPAEARMIPTASFITPCVHVYMHACTRARVQGR
jgi:hypothetical protein